ncbi:MAG TPA: biosynthetic-type acetolactate synthase large subunit [Anaerohalosphaeraceae bacterium]|nr:biosynthetic-type acetolactate synthase large subunit [Phycisphaerae bacterium]HOK96082.1 biosynthetic-type acetolactate synthase large subunit [Anaerohalosphaeraceae bacterium]HOL30964.1 biosynthetic-type acetolactate synthase large subunit [Anaerohalosphaeraceae bacterium]HOM75342.1 biosynthetic-type acetolactate synthase large subunit [Anaerohalosphaeraceae bacterium]HPC63330.1 biosynthetic-type acetolactate synthase large subunit [Anaerohalosphaeraceae bacterium]
MRKNGTPSDDGKVIKVGSQVIVDMLLEQGIDTMFGYLGGVVLPLFDKLYEAPIRFIIPRHEQGGCHMADAYARATGKPGVVVATSGPGATNLTTGLATAMMDSVPIVALTGQVRTSLIGNDAFQEADTTGITRPITKHNVIVKDPNTLAQTIREAFYIATTGRPGPVLIDIPVDMQLAQCPIPPKGEIELPGFKNRQKGHSRQISAAAAAINQSQKPVLYVGGGAILSGASEILRAVAQKANIPVTMTLMALGAYDQTRPESLDMLGMHGSAYANYAVQNADLIISVGARFDDRVTGNLATFAPHAKIIHIDVDPANIGKNLHVDIPVVGDAKQVLEEMIGELEYKQRKEWFAQIAAWKAKHPFTYDRKTDVIKPQYVIEEIYRQTKGDAIICTGVGQHQMWTAQFYKFSRPRQLITSGGLGTMGYGLPAAIGVKIACPDKLVIDIDGDSSFNMTLTELSTAVMYNLPIKVALINNGYMGMVRQWQELFYGGRYSQSSLVNPDFANLARAFGCVGITVEKKEQVPGAVEQMLAETRPCVVDFHVDRQENVWPMVPAGKSLHEMDGLDIFEMA